MNEEQTMFFQRLCATFDPDQVRSYSASGRTLHYVTSRTIWNRLDDVCGVAGWYPEYQVHANGVSCKLHLNVPQEDGTWGWLYKEDGGGYADMKAQDDNEKSGYTDAVKRAAMAWGIARYLYRDGSPEYLGDQPPPAEGGRGPSPQQRPAAPQRPQQPQQRPAPPARQAAAPVAPARPAPGRPGPAPRPQQPQQPQQPQRQYDNFAPPTRQGKGMFAWMKGLEEHFGGGIVEAANAYAHGQGYLFKATDWDDYQVQDVAWYLIDMLKAWENYNGEFEHLEDPRENPQ